MADSNPKWTVMSRPDAADGFSLIMRGGRWIITSVILASIIALFSMRPGIGFAFGMIVSTAVSTIGIVIGIQNLIMGTIKYAHEVWRS